MPILDFISKEDDDSFFNTNHYNLKITVVDTSILPNGDIMNKATMSYCYYDYPFVTMSLKDFIKKRRVQTLAKIWNIFVNFNGSGSSKYMANCYFPRHGITICIYTNGN